MKPLRIKSTRPTATAALLGLILSLVIKSSPFPSINLHETKIQINMKTELFQKDWKLKAIFIISWKAFISPMKRTKYIHVPRNVSQINSSGRAASSGGVFGFKLSCCEESEDTTSSFARGSILILSCWFENE